MVQDEDQKSKEAKSVESSCLHQGSDKQGGNPVLILTVDSNNLHQTSDCNKLPLPYILLSAQPYHSGLHLPGAGINGLWLLSAEGTFI